MVSVQPIFLHFRFEKDHSYFLSSFPTTPDHFQFLFSVFETLIRYRVPSLFVDRVQKGNVYIFVTTLACKNINRNLFGFYFSLNMLFLSFQGIMFPKSF